MQIAHHARGQRPGSRPALRDPRWAGTQTRPVHRDSAITTGSNGWTTPLYPSPRVRKPMPARLVIVLSVVAVVLASAVLSYILGALH
jgi:hypothetical protein